MSPHAASHSLARASSPRAGWGGLESSSRPAFRSSHRSRSSRSHTWRPRVRSTGPGALLSVHSRRKVENESPTYSAASGSRMPRGQSGRRRPKSCRWSCPVSGPVPAMESPAPAAEPPFRRSVSFCDFIASCDGPPALAPLLLAREAGLFLATNAGSRRLGGFCGSWDLKPRSERGNAGSSAGGSALR